MEMHQRQLDQPLHLKILALKQCAMSEGPTQLKQGMCNRVNTDDTVSWWSSYGVHTLTMSIARTSTAWYTAKQGTPQIQLELHGR